MIFGPFSRRGRCVLPPLRSRSVFDRHGSITRGRTRRYRYRGPGGEDGIKETNNATARLPLPPIRAATALASSRLEPPPLRAGRLGGYRSACGYCAAVSCTRTAARAHAPVRNPGRRGDAPGVTVLGNLARERAAAADVGRTRDSTRNGRGRYQTLPLVTRHYATVGRNCVSSSRHGLRCLAVA